LQGLTPGQPHHTILAYAFRFVKRKVRRDTKSPSSAISAGVCMPREVCPGENRRVSGMRGSAQPANHSAMPSVQWLATRHQSPLPRGSLSTDGGRAAADYSVISVPSWSGNGLQHAILGHPGMEVSVSVPSWSGNALQLLHAQRNDAELHVSVPSWSGNTLQLREICANCLNVCVSVPSWSGNVLQPLP
jgi:hypothetical protein